MNTKTRPLVMRLVDMPRHLARDMKQPKPFREVKLGSLCRTAGISCRVTIASPPKILLHAGRNHHSLPGIYFVGVARKSVRLTRTAALRILEVLAYSFFDYGARESVCGRGLFVGE